MCQFDQIIKCSEGVFFHCDRLLKISAYPFSGAAVPDSVIVHFLLLQSDSGEGKMTNGLDGNGFLELSFEYLMAKDTLKWITITSDQVCAFSYTLDIWYLGSELKIHYSLKPICANERN